MNGDTVSSKKDGENPWQFNRSILIILSKRSEKIAVTDHCRLWRMAWEILNLLCHPQNQWRKGMMELTQRSHSLGLWIPLENPHKFQIRQPPGPRNHEITDLVVPGHDDRLCWEWCQSSTGPILAIVFNNVFKFKFKLNPACGLTWARNPRFSRSSFYKTKRTDNKLTNIRSINFPCS